MKIKKKTAQDSSLIVSDLQRNHVIAGKAAPGPVQSEAPPDRTRKLKWPQDPNPRDLRDSTDPAPGRHGGVLEPGPQSRKKVSGSLSDAGHSALINYPLTSTPFNPPPVYNTYPAARRHLHREVNGQPENAVKRDLKP